MSIPPKAIYRINAILIKIPMTYFTKLENISKIYMEPPKAPHCNSNPEKEKQSWKNHAMLPNMKLYCKAIVIKTAWYWHQNRHIDQWNRIESPEINSHVYSQYLTEEASTHNGLKKVY